MKKIMMLLIFFTFFGGIDKVEADTSTPYGNDPVNFLAGQELIVYAVKMDGPVSYGAYSDYFYNSQSSLTEDEIKENWQESLAGETERFLVLRVIKGDKGLIGKLIDSDIRPSYINTTIGNKYILFLSGDTDGYYSYDVCNVADVSHLDNEYILDVISIDSTQIVVRLFDEHLMACEQLGIR